MPMSSATIKATISGTIGAALVEKDWDVFRVDARTIQVRVPGDGGPRYFIVQVKEQIKGLEKELTK